MTPLLLTIGDSFGWHGGTDHWLVAWDATHVAVVFSDAGASADESGGIVQMVTIDPVTGSMVTGPRTKYYGLGDPEDEGGRHHEAERVGDLLVCINAYSGRIFTFTYDPGTNAFTLADIGTIAAGDLGPSSHARVLPWGGDTMLLVKPHISSSLPGVMQFWRWTGTTWETSPVAASPPGTSYGSADYMYLVRIVDQATPGAKTALVLLQETTGMGRDLYVTVTGDYPASPVVTIAEQETTGSDFYFNVQWWSCPISNYAHSIRAIPVLSGTLTPTSTGSSFDWAYMLLTLNAGVVTEGPLTRIGSADDYYDLAMTETTDANIWAAYAQAGYPATQNVGIRNVTGEAEFVLTQGTEGGVTVADYSVRNLARLGRTVAYCWTTEENRKLYIDFRPVAHGVGSLLRGDRNFVGRA